MDDINRVARLMVDAEPSADLDARIRARLDEVPAVADPRAWRPWQVAAGLAVAATIALLVWVPGPEVQRSGGLEVLGSGNVSAIAQNAPSTSTEAPASRPGVPMDLRTPGPQDLRTPGPQDPTSAVPSTLSAEESAWMDRRIPALDPVVALEMDHLSMQSIQPEPLAITPLIMTALPTESGTTERRER